MAPGATLLIDGSSLAYRAYHAIPVITAPDRVTETNAVHGFLNFLSRLIPDRRPSRLWVALDADWRPAFRVDALASYKAHRVAGADDPPDPVEPQIALIIEVLGAFGVSTARAEGYEAEDAIASIHAKYGIPGDRYMDYAILRGDPSDGLPGVAGIGEKTASELLRKYGSLDGILAARDLSPTIRAKLHRGAEYLVGARTVVALAEDCPVEGGTGEIPTVAADDARLRALQDRLGIAAPLERLRAAIRLASAPA